VYSLELLGGGVVGGDGVGGDGVGNQGKGKEHPLQPKIRLISANAIRMYLIFFSILLAGFIISLLFLFQKSCVEVHEWSDLIYYGWYTSGKCLNLI